MLFLEGKLNTKTKSDFDLCPCNVWITMFYFIMLTCYCTFKWNVFEKLWKLNLGGTTFLHVGTLHDLSYADFSTSLSNAIKYIVFDFISELALQRVNQLKQKKIPVKNSLLFVWLPWHYFITARRCASSNNL